MAKTKLQLLKGAFQNWTNQNPPDFHSIHWEPLKVSKQVHVERDKRGMKIFQRHGALWLPTELPLPLGRWILQPRLLPKNWEIDSWKEPKNLNSAKFNPNWNIFDTICIVKDMFLLIFMHYNKLGNSWVADFSWMSPNEDQDSSDGCSFTVASEKPVGNLCTSRHYFQYFELFPRDLKPLFTWGVLVMGNYFLWASSHGDVPEAVKQMRFSQWGAETQHHKRSNQTFWPLAISVWKIIDSVLKKDENIHKLDVHEVGRFIRDAGWRANFSCQKCLQSCRQRKTPVVTKLKDPLLFDKLHRGDGA